MDIYSYLKKDHKKVNKLMNDLLTTDDNNERMQLFENIKHELLLHAKTEQDTFYKELESKRQTEEKMEHAEDEHKEIEKYLKKLSQLEFGSEQWIEQFGEFKHSVLHHVKEEEGEIFDKAKKLLSDSRAEALAEEMDELKQSEKYQKKADAF